MKNYKVELNNYDMNNLSVLSADEMNELFIKYQSGDKSAKDKLIEGNLKLVLSILKKYNNGKNSIDDLFQVGVIGLIKAIDNFDLSYNLMFSTYAVTLIMGEIRRFIRDNTPYRVSRSIKELSYDILSYKESYTNIYGVEPSFKTIAKHFDISEYKAANALESLSPTVSIYEPIYQDSGEPIYLLDQLADLKTNDYTRDDLLALKAAFKNLKSREKDVLIKRYVIGKTQMELAKEYNISQAQVSRIEKTALARVKKMVD